MAVAQYIYIFNFIAWNELTITELGTCHCCSVDLKQFLGQKRIACRITAKYGVEHLLNLKVKRFSYFCVSQSP